MSPVYLRMKVGNIQDSFVSFPFTMLCFFPNGKDLITSLEFVCLNFLNRLHKNYFVFGHCGYKSNKKNPCFSLFAEYSPVDDFISSELPVLFELRVRYLLSCERVSEAMALAKCCAWHPTAGQHLFFLQVYLSWLLKKSQHDILHKEVGVLLLCFCEKPQITLVFCVT